jgi:hypothetical protein
MSIINMAIDDLVTPENTIDNQDQVVTSGNDLELGSEEPQTDIPVMFSEIEPIIIDTIIDKQGRLSDILESIEEECGISVIPLKMAEIAPEVAQLKRHEIFTLGNERYAFSHRVRLNVCDHYLEQIVSCLSEGVPFTLDLATTISWHDSQYNTFLLSRDEWTYIMSKCRNFKQKLTTDGKSQITLHIFAEKAK